MDESNYYFKRSHVPAFGSWDCNDNEIPIPFTECFESARQASLFHYSYSQDSDLYVTGDLYHNDIVTPTMIVVPRRKKKASYKEARKDAWVVCDFEKEAPSPVPISPPTAKSVPKNPIDEDLYKISPELLYAKPTRKGVRAIISSCLRPACAC
ncbi:uncharacterized protein [Nicotiana tomentosiformis]|uniref:Uncharacterized protein isoform X2 n=1 Tax=Nicotiana tabacum TaxID=4097 RepID=A0A1S4A0T7_TOBAC|nr:uncharacterized protein LOC104085438 [Nicotiana tomentosiformis]XP_016470297.1 PREDICTED: uncharacterized protein LOC107792588 isoform X2 [Nicotiana tabacum]